MAKFRSPFNTNELWLTQTLHTQSNNTAIDLSAVAETPVYAIADGTVTYRSSLAGSYCIQQIDNSDLKVYYVHTYKWVGANTYVKKGQIICYIAPTSLNGGYPTHLHLGLPTGKGIMDYFDRSLVFTTNYADIKAIWFKNGSLDWTLFKDLSYENISVSNFKIGDRIEFTGTQTKRGAPAGSDIGGSQIGMLGTIKDGPRYAVLNGVNYEWWDIQPDSEASGWFAWVNKWKLYTPPVANPCEEIERENGRLNNRIGILEQEKQIMAQEIKKLMTENGKVVEKYNTAILEKQELVSQLNQCKSDLEQGQKNFIEKIKNWIGELLENLSRSS